MPKPRRYFNVTIQRFPSVSCQAGDFIGFHPRLVQVFDHHQEYLELELNLYLACGVFYIAEKTVFMNFFFGIGRNPCNCMFLYVQQTCPLVPLKMASLLFCPWTKLLVLPGWRKSLKMVITMVAFVFFHGEKLEFVLEVISWWWWWWCWWYHDLMHGFIERFWLDDISQSCEVAYLVCTLRSRSRWTESCCLWISQLLHAWFLGIFLRYLCLMILVWCTKPFTRFTKESFREFIINQYLSIFRRFRKGYPPWN